MILTCFLTHTRKSNLGWTKRCISLFPAGIEPATLPVWRARDNHYTKETSCLRLQVPMSQCSARDHLPRPMTFGSSPTLATRTCGATDNALDYESRDCRFESCQVRQNLFPHFLCKKRPSLQNGSPPGGLEPPTFRLTAERASRLRHGGRYYLTRKFTVHVIQETHFFLLKSVTSIHPIITRKQI